MHSCMPMQRPRQRKSISAAHAWSSSDLSAFGGDEEAPLTALGVSPTWVTSSTPVCANQISVCVDGNQRGQTTSSSFSGSPWSHSLCMTSMSSAQAQLLLDASVVPHLVQLLDPSSAFTADKLESVGNFSHSNHHHWHVQLALL